MIDRNRGRTGEQTTRILVLDDHDISRRYAVAALRQAGVTVKASGRPAAALRMAVEWLPDAVLVDIRLPGTDGHAWVGRLREHWPPHRPLPRFVLLSAEAPVSDRHRSSGQAPLTRLCKPAPPDELRRALGLHHPPPRCSADAIRGRPAGLRLRSLFRTELSRRLPELDELLARRQLAAAARLLHQLLAASRMCRERQVERGLRGLLHSCRLHAVSKAGGSADVARSYFALRVAAAPLIEAPAPTSG